MHNFCTAELVGLPDSRVKVIRQFNFPTGVGSKLGEAFGMVMLLPYFCSWSGKRSVNPARTIEALREITKIIGPRMPLTHPPITEGIEIHLFREITKRTPLRSDGMGDLLDIDQAACYIPLRSAFVVACSFYLNTLLGEWSVERLRTSHLWYLMFELLKTDIDQTKGALRMEGLKSDFWLWKVLIVAIGAVDMENQSRQWAFDDCMSEDDLFRGLKAWCSDHIRTWSCATGITDWPTANQALSNIVWSDKFCHGVTPASVFLAALRDDAIF